MRPLTPPLSVYSAFPCRGGLYWPPRLRREAIVMSPARKPRSVGRSVRSPTSVAYQSQQKRQSTMTSHQNVSET